MVFFEMFPWELSRCRKWEKRRRRIEIDGFILFCLFCLCFCLAHTSTKWGNVLLLRMSRDGLKSFLISTKTFWEFIFFIRLYASIPCYFKHIRLHKIQENREEKFRHVISLHLKRRWMPNSYRMGILRKIFSTQISHYCIKESSTHRMPYCCSCCSWQTINVNIENSSYQHDWILEKLPFI